MTACRFSKFLMIFAIFLGELVVCGGVGEGGGVGFDYTVHTFAVSA